MAHSLFIRIGRRAAAWRLALTLLVAPPLALGAPSAQAQSFHSAAPFALLADYESGSLLYEKNAAEPMEPASTTKLLTAEIVFDALKRGKLRLDDAFPVSEYAWRAGGAPAHGSAMFLAPHSRVRVEDLLRGLLIQSGNDAAIVLAEGVAGSAANFVALMNKRAAELGMGHSSFTNPWGNSEPGHRVTARDMALLAAHIVRTYPEYYGYFSEREFTWNAIRQLNRNPLLGMNAGADGLKTGETSESGFGLVGSAVQDGRRLIVVVNGLKTAGERSEEAHRLLRHGFDDFEERPLFEAGAVVGAASVYGGDRGEAPLRTEAPVTVFLPRGSTEKFTAQIVYRGPLLAPVPAGLEAARLKVFRGDTLLSDAPLQTAEAVAQGGLARRALDAVGELAGAAIRKLMQGKS